MDPAATDVKSMPLPDAGKIVVHWGYSDLEAVNDRSLPEVVGYYPGAAISAGPPSYIDEKDRPRINNGPFWTRWSRRTRWIVLGLLLLAVVLAIALGLGIPLAMQRVKQGNEGTSAESTEDTESPAPTESASVPVNPDAVAATRAAALREICGGDPRNQLRRQVLSSAYLDGELFFFARTQDNDIAVRSRAIQDIIDSPGAWPDDWAPVVSDGSAPFVSPPSAMVWNSTKLSVMATSLQQDNVLITKFEDSRWGNAWENLGSASASPIAACVAQDKTDNTTRDRLDLWMLHKSNRTYVHNWYNWRDETFHSPSLDDQWDSTAEMNSVSMPAIACRQENPVHAIFGFASGTDSLRVRYYLAGSENWTRWTVDLGGNFRGDPVVVKVKEESELHVFGVGADGRMYRLMWRGGEDSEAASNKPALQAAGGNFTSVPSVVVTKDEDGSDRVHVVALGADGALKHRSYAGHDWEGDWVDMGVQGVSAPLAFTYECDERGPMAGVAVVGVNNTLRMATWKATDTAAWNSQAVWYDLGGSINPDGMCM